MPSKTRFGSATAGVVVEGNLVGLAEEAMDRIMPGVRDVVNSHVDDVYNEALIEWPIRTGASARSLRRVNQFDASSYAAKIEVIGVDYTFYVRPKKWFGAETAWVRLIKKPMAKSREEIIKDPQLYDVILKALKEGFNG